MLKIFTGIFCLFSIALKSSAQETVLDNYIKTGLENNLALNQKLASYEKSIQALREAKGLFFPQISFNARYTVAEGGRIIPVGDMVDPILNNLNALNDIVLGSTIDYTELTSQEFQFFRPKEHETKISIVQPLFNPQIYYNNKIKNYLVKAERSDAETYKRYLVAEIKTAYYNYLKTAELNQLIDNTRKLLEENVRVNKSLYKNDKLTIDNVFRSEAELSKLDQQKAESIMQKQMAESYFNFLLNRNHDTEIITDTSELITRHPATFEEARLNALNNRDELEKIKSYINVAENNYKINSYNRLPVLLGAVDYGFQGETYSFTSEDDYVLASIVLRWDLFKGFQNNAKLQQAKIDKEIMENQYEELESLIQLEVVNAFYALEAAEKEIVSSGKQLESSKKAFKIINRKYAEGQASLIEYIDARTNMTNTGQNLIIAKYDYLIKYAEYERVTGLYNFSQVNSQ
jgi:outer membrane protein